MIERSLYSSPLGEMALLSDGERLLRLTFNTCSVPDYPVGEDSPIRTAKKWLDDYFSGLNPSCSIPLLIEGTSFQKEVWEILQTIPYGETMTYGDIASLIAERRGIRRMSAQAVGGAVGSNPFVIMIPCHRVLGKNGSLTGYSEGIERKMALLDLEGIPYRN